MQSLAQAARWPVKRSAVGVFGLEGVRRHVACSGCSQDEAFPWASVTKLTTALAVLVAVEEGTVALADPLGPPGSTIAHLLAHASGLAPDGQGVLAAPGTRRIYSNEGFRLLGRALAARSGLPYGRYLAEAVLEPLGMAAAFGPDEDPAAGLAGSLADLVALGGELLSPTLVHPSTLAGATAVAFPGLAGVLPGFGRQDPCDWGLGFEVRDAKRPHWTGAANSPATFGHFGQSGGFLWVDPAAQACCAVLTDRPFGPWAAAAWPALSDAVLQELAG